MCLFFFWFHLWFWNCLFDIRKTHFFQHSSSIQAAGSILSRNDLLATLNLSIDTFVSVNGPKNFMLNKKYNCDFSKSYLQLQSQSVDDE